MTWRTQAACRTLDTAEAMRIFFPTETMGRPTNGDPYAEARAICATCPVKAACLADAMGTEADQAKTSRHGMFGGMSPEERWSLSLGASTCPCCGRDFVKRTAKHITCGEPKCRARNHNMQVERRERNRRWMQEARSDGRVA